MDDFLDSLGSLFGSGSSTLGSIGNIAALGSLLSGGVGSVDGSSSDLYNSAQQESQQAYETALEAAGLWGGLGNSPTSNYSAVSPLTVGTYTAPTVQSATPAAFAAAALAQANPASTINDSQTGNNSILGALQSLSQYGNTEGMNTGEQAQANANIANALQVGAQNRDATTQQMIAQGGGGSGLQYLLGQQAGQAGENTAASMGNTMFAQAIQDRLSALAQSGSLGSALQQNTDNVAAQNASILNNYNQWTTQLAQQNNQYNAGQLNSYDQNIYNNDNSLNEYNANLANTADENNTSALNNSALQNWNNAQNVSNSNTAAQNAWTTTKIGGETNALTGVQNEQNAQSAALAQQAAANTSNNNSLISSSLNYFGKTNSGSNTNNSGSTNVTNNSSSSGSGTGNNYSSTNEDYEG